MPQYVMGRKQEHIQSRNAAEGSTVMFLPVCLRQDGVAVLGIAEALAKGARPLVTWDLLRSPAQP